MKRNSIRKGITVLLLMVALLSGCITASNVNLDVPATAEVEKNESLKDGTYEATSNGNNGAMTVSITVKNGEITNHSESKGIGDIAVAKIPQKIIEGQTLAVDIMSGATITSYGILKGVEDCIKQAGGDPDSFKVATSKTPKELIKLETEVLVVGAGTSGISASLSAANNGAKVILICNAPMSRG